MEGTDEKCCDNFANDKKMKKKILFLGNCYYVIFRFRRELVIKCAEEGYDVWTAFPNGSHGEAERGEETAKELGCHFIEIKINRRAFHPVGEIRLCMRIRDIVRQIRPDILLTYTVKPNLYGAAVARAYGIPYIMNITGLGSALGKRGLLYGLLRRLTIRNMKTASCVFFQNEQDRIFFQTQGYCETNIEMLPGSGVNLEEYQLLDYPDGKTIRFLYAARVMREKGIEQFLALAEHYKERKEIGFHICGDCEEDYESLLRRLEREKIVIYHGQVSNVINYLECCHCLVLPTFYHEGVSNSLLEAAACGRPIITTDHPGCREAVENGVSGYLVRTQDKKDLIDKAEKFLQLTNEERAEMGRAGRRKMEREFNREIVVGKYFEAITDILRESPS